MNKVNESKDSMIGKWPYPIDFLKDYMDFAVKARSITVKALAKSCNNSMDMNEKWLLYFLGFEQCFFSLESLLAFFNVAVHASPVDLAKWIMPIKRNCRIRSYSFHELQCEIDNEITEKYIQRIYTEEFPEFQHRKLKTLTAPLMEILIWLKTKTPDRFTPLITIFNRTKHKFLAYRFNNRVAFLLSEASEKDLAGGSLKYPRHKKNAKDKHVPDFSLFIDLIETAERYTKIAIQKIILRLSKPGANKWISGPGRNADLITLPLKPLY